MAVIEKHPKWYNKFAAIVEDCWEHHAPSVHLNIRTLYDTEAKEWLIYCAPVFQEVLGGEHDGETTWASFIFHGDDFVKSDGVYVENFAVASPCKECNTPARMLFRGKYRGRRFNLQVLLEPPKGSDVVEVIDVINDKIRLKGKNDNDSKGDDQTGDDQQKPRQGDSTGLFGEAATD